MTSQRLEILDVGAVGNPLVKDGRPLPFVTVKCSDRPDIERLIELHGSRETPGDVICTWGWPAVGHSTVLLKLDFQRPLVATATLAFPVSTEGFIVDWIMTVNGLYLQSSKYGTRASEGFGKPAIVVEVPRTAGFPKWEKIYKKALKKRFKKEGLRGKALEEAITQYKSAHRQGFQGTPKIKG